MRVTSIAPRVIPSTLSSSIAMWLEKAPAITLDAFHWADTFCLATGVYAPVTGFQGRRAVQAVLEDWRLPDQSPWPIPITLPVDAELASGLRKADLARLVWNSTTVAILNVEEVFWLDPEEEAYAVYGTLDPSHPGVARVLQVSPIRVAGTVTLVESPMYPVDPVLTPHQMRDLIQQRGWKTVVGFQTRNPLHRAHEYIQKTALETHDGLVLHPLVGYTKADDVPVEVRWRVYEALVSGYFPASRTILSGFPAPMRYGGPKEAVLHALCRKNYGITHFIVGRDHAGVGTFYDPLASQNVFQRFSEDELGIRIIAAEPAFYCYRCLQMATSKTCPHPIANHEVLSGTRVRTTLRGGGELPSVAIRPEVTAILQEYYQSR